MEIAKTAVSSSSSSFKRPTARLVGPETMIHSPNCFALSCIYMPFRNLLYFDAILLRDQGAARANLMNKRMRVAAFIREACKS